MWQLNVICFVIVSVNNRSNISLGHCVTFSVSNRSNISLGHCVTFSVSNRSNISLGHCVTFSVANQTCAFLCATRVLFRRYNSRHFIKTWLRFIPTTVHQLFISLPNSPYFATFPNFPFRFLNCLTLHSLTNSSSSPTMNFISPSKLKVTLEESFNSYL